MPSDVAADTKLQHKWTIWYDKKQVKSKEEKIGGAAGSTSPAVPSKASYVANLHDLGSFDSPATFADLYAHLARPSALPLTGNYHIFHSGPNGQQLQPTWETWPEGGCWVVRLKKQVAHLDQMWEELVLCAIGEMFEEPCVVGVEVSIRQKEDLLSVWLSKVTPEVQFQVGDKLRTFLNLADGFSLEFKTFSSSLRDGSSFRHGIAYVGSPQVSKKSVKK